MFYLWVGISANYGSFIVIPSPRLATFSLLIAWLIPTEVVSENDWHLQRKFYLADRYKDFFLATFCRQKVAQKPRGDNFRGHTQKFSKTDAFALLLREKVSVF